MKRNTFLGGTEGGSYVGMVASLLNGKPYNHTFLVVEEKTSGGEVLSVFTSEDSSAIFDVSSLKDTLFSAFDNVLKKKYKDMNYTVYTDKSKLGPSHFKINKLYLKEYKDAPRLTLKYFSEGLPKDFTITSTEEESTVSNDFISDYIPFDPKVYTSKEEKDNIKNNAILVKGCSLPVFLEPTLNSFKEGTHNCALFYGEAAVGKSFATRIMAAHMCIPVVSYNFSAGSDESIIQGKFAPRDNADGFELLRSLFINAYTKGWLFIAEELNYAFANVTGPLNSALDFVKHITLVNETQLEMHPNFRFVSCINPGYEGTQPLNRALLSRQELVVRFNNLTEDDFATRLFDRLGYANKKFAKELGGFLTKLNNILYSQGIDGYASMREAESLIKLLKHTPFDVAIRQTVFDKVLLNETPEVYKNFIESCDRELEKLKEAYSINGEAELVEFEPSLFNDDIVSEILSSAKKKYEEAQK